MLGVIGIFWYQYVFPLLEKNRFKMLSAGFSLDTPDGNKEMNYRH
jgi:hypothetical protein